MALPRASRSLVAAILSVSATIPFGAAARSAPPAPADDGPPAGVAPDSLYVVAVSHLDTQWLWDIVETVTTYIPATFRDTMDQIDRHPGFRFGFEGAHRYHLLREYYPDLWERLKAYVADGRWSPSGSALEGGDVNIPSPESLTRQFLYGNGFFRREFGRTSADVFLPDCFGFGWALPSVAAHCGLKGFSTQKLAAWGSAIGVPFDVGRWRGPDGAEIVAALDPGGYTEGIVDDWSLSTRWMEALARQEAKTGLRLGYGYFGVGDRGGGMREDDLAMLDASRAGPGTTKVLSVPSDEMFRMLSPEQVAAMPVHEGELLLSTHGTGAYTSQCAMKRWNRQNEQLGDAAERASVAAAWLGGTAYPGAWLSDAWFRFLVHQFHDDVTGTSIPEVYGWSWNDERIAQHRFATALSAAVGRVAAVLDTTATGVPLVVYNAVSADREDLVEALVRFPGEAPPHVRVFGPDGAEVPAQVTGVRDGAVAVAFLARVPANGLAVFDARPSEVPCGLDTGLAATAAGLENGRYRVSLDASGDVSSVFDKAAGREILASPVRLTLFNDVTFTYPAWEIPWFNLMDGPREYVEGPFEARVVESGPARVAIEVRREYTAAEIGGTSTYVLRLRLAAGGAGDVLEWDAGIEWGNRMSLLKVEFPLANPAPGATFDLGLGVLHRPNADGLLYEVPAQQWADVTPPDGAYGASVLTRDKVAWHKFDDATLYLTLIHTSMMPDHHHDTNDIGHHRTGWALFGHAGDWTRGTAAQAARYNQPLLAFQSTSHPGALGTSFAFGTVSDPAVALRALKGAEESDEVVVRLQETSGTARTGVRVDIGSGIASAREVFGDEQPRGDATVVDGTLVADLSPFQPRTFAVRLLPPPAVTLAPPASTPVALPLDTDVVSANDARGDGGFGASGSAFPAEQWPASLAVGGASFTLGPAGPGESNAVTCRGQSVSLGEPPAAAGERLHLLVAAEGDVDAAFRVGDRSTALHVQDAGGFIGQWDSRVVDGSVVDDPVPAVPAFLKPAEVAWYGTHRHRPDGDAVYAFGYLFRHVLEVPEGSTTLTLPDDPRVKVFAASRVLDAADGTVPASILFDDFDPLARPIPGWEPAPPPPEPEPDTAEEADASPPDEPPDADAVEPDVPPDGLAPDLPAEVPGPDVPPPDIVAPDSLADAAGPDATPDGTKGSSGGCAALPAGRPGAALPALLAGLLALGLAARVRRRHPAP